MAQTIEAPSNVGELPAPTQALATSHRHPSWAVGGAAISILAALLLGFVADITALGTLRHYRNQQTSYANFRVKLANGTAPVGQTDAKGRLYPLGTAVTSGVLESGPGHLRDTPLPGQPGISVVMGRQAAFGGPFGALDKLRSGDPLTVTTGQGVQAFKVLDVRRAGDLLPPVLATGGSRIVLVTGDGPAFGPHGLLYVDAELTSTVQPANTVTTGFVTGAERPMAGDPGALYVLVLWAEALVVAAAGVAWLRLRWGRWQSWLVGVPVLAALGIAVANQIAELLPNLL
jgi:hypothetical protein